MLKLKLQYFGHLMRRTELIGKKPWCWERLKAGGEGDDRRWDYWRASLTQWTWVWVSSRSWWWTGKPGVLQSMGSQMVGHDWMTELNWCLQPSLVLLEEGICYGQGVLLVKLCQFLPCFFLYRPNLPVTPGISWLLTFAFQIRMMKRTSFFLVLDLEGVVGLHRTIQLQLFWH